MFPLVLANFKLNDLNKNIQQFYIMKINENFSIVYHLHGVICGSK